MNLIPGEINLSFFPIILPSLLLIFVLLNLKRTSLIRRPPLPPGPFAWPLVGNLFQMGKNPHVVLANLARLHGPLISLRLGARVLVVASSPEAAAEVLKTHDRALSGRYVSRPLRIKGSKLYNLSVGFSEECSDHWKSLRNIYRSELFSGKAMESQVEVRENKVAEMVKYLSAKEGQVVKIKEIVVISVLNMLSNALFSMDIANFEGDGQEMGQLIRRYTEAGATTTLSDLYPVFAGWDPQCMYKKVMDFFDKISVVWIDIVKERRKQRNNVSSRQDFLDALIGLGLSNDQIDPLLVELFGAGTESTSATSEWALTELIRNQEAMQKLRDELEKVIGRQETVRESNLPQLPYLKACVKETLRLHPPGPLLLPHRAVQTCQVMGYTIPKDIQVMVNIWAIARDPKIWDDPLCFRPERFLKSGLDYMGTDFEYIPFGSGRRMCTGLPMASRTIPLILASLIQQFDWRLPGNMNPTDIDMNEKVDVTMLKEEPLWVIPKLRK